MKRSLLSILFFFLAGGLCGAQTLREAAALHRAYQFDQAITQYERILEQRPGDSLALQGLVEAENGKALTSWVFAPQVVATKRVPRKDFQLWYGHLADGTWTPDGNRLPDGTGAWYFSRENAAGDRDIYCATPVDSALWSVPAPVCADAVSPGNELFPMLSPDGKRLYFSSNGLFGMGGYDLYVALWNPVSQTWGQVQNLGFPYSSTGDDLLFCDTEDGRYSLFASNRDCGADSVVIYVLRQENPVSAPIGKASPATLAHLTVREPDNGYPFVRRNYGVLPELAFEEPEPVFDDAFRIDESGAFAENDQIPTGLVYQIQLFVTSVKPTVKQLKGVRPVYSHRQRSGKTLYAAGVFQTYAEAELALAAVRKAGHKTAIIIAYENRAPLSVAKARQKESSVKVVTEEVHIVK